MDILITGVVCFAAGYFIRYCGYAKIFRSRVNLIVNDYERREKRIKREGVYLLYKLSLLENHMERLGFYVDPNTNKLHRKKK